MKYHQLRRAGSGSFQSAASSEPANRSAPGMPGFLQLSDREFREKRKKSLAVLKCCSLCPNTCRVNRWAGQRGKCGQGALPTVARAIPHHGEEPPLSGKGGAGTIFFSGCTMKCLFCQNFQISHEMMGEEISIKALASSFLELRERGCHNLELVSPTPHLPFILEALREARYAGFDLPVIYNTNGFISMEGLDLLDGIVDVYLPDMKYSLPLHAAGLSLTPGYVEHNRTAVKEMFRQCGQLLTDDNGLAKKGVIVRILLLPSGQDGAEQTIDFLAEKVSTEITLSLMSQYSPLHGARAMPDLREKIEPDRVNALVKRAISRGFSDIWTQHGESADLFIPDFRREDPFI